MNLKYPTIYGCASQQELVKNAFQWLEADWLCFDSLPWSVDFVCRNAVEIHCVQGYSFMGASPAPGIIAVTTAALDCPDWLVASVLIHECNHQSWLRLYGTAVNSRVEEIDCLEQQRGFLDRAGCPTDWMKPLFEKAAQMRY